jgi:site-specific DNA recombinase
MKAIILARVSTEEQMTEGQSIPAQVAKAREYAKRKNLNVIKEFDFDESSTKDKRSKYEEVVKEIKRSKTAIALVVETVDRLQRGFKESVMLDDYRKSGKLEIHFIRENLVVHKDSNSSEIQRWDLAVFVAKSYVLQISDNIKRTFEHRIKNGEIIRIAPLGYLNVDKNEDTKDVIFDDKTAHLVKMIFELYATGNYSMRMIAEKVSGLGLKTPRSNKPVSIRSIEEILKNPFYYGMQRYKGDIYPHKYEALIDYELFMICENVRKRFRKQPTKLKATPYILKGLLTCARCGCAITPEIKKGKYVYYHCTNYKGNCKKVFVREEQLLEPIMEVFDRIRLSDEQIAELTNDLRVAEEVKCEFHSHQMRKLRSEYDRIENRISVMYEDRLDGRITEEQYDAKLKEFKTKQHELSFKMKRYEKADELFYNTANKVLSLAQRSRDLFESSEIPEKRQLINFVFQNLKLDGKTVQYKLKTPFLRVLEANSSNVWSGLLDAFRTIDWIEFQSEMKYLPIEWIKIVVLSDD